MAHLQKVVYRACKRTGEKGDRKNARQQERKREEGLARMHAVCFVSTHRFTSASVSHTHTHEDKHGYTYTLFILYLEEKPWCLNSFGIKFELNKSADLPLRQYMSYGEH